MKRTRLNRQPKYKKHLRRWKIYLSITIVVWVLIYLILLGTIQFTKQLFNIVAEAPTKVIAKELPTPTPAPPTLNPDLTEREQNIELIKKIWGKDREIGLAIAKAESGYRSKATNYNTNGTVDQGCFQINSVHRVPEMDNAVANISYAYTIFLKQGTTPWNSSKHNWGGQL